MEPTSEIPAFLWMPFDSAIDPPVESRLQLLPIEKLKWEAFERLCARLARREADIQYCYLYGQPGQAQEGIDLYGRTSSQRFTTWQCKRYAKSFTAANLRSAANAFLKGSWAVKTERFHICGTVPIERKPLIEEVEILIE